MYKFLIITLVFVSGAVKANLLEASQIVEDGINIQVQNKDSVMYSFQYIDSLTYNYYLNGDWDRLIEIGNKAIHVQIDYKRLRQRIGYAYFSKADYYSAQNQYEKALAFDKTDLDTRFYLYYCGLYNGNDSYARYQLSKLPAENQKKLNNKTFKIVDASDFEYNNKINNSGTRSNPNYWRIGISTKLGNLLNLYQSVSTYSQRIDSTSTVNEFLDKSYIDQKEYVASLSLILNQNIDVTLGYHYINTKLVDSISYHYPLFKRDTVIIPTNRNYNMIFSKVSFRLDRFDLGVSGSVLMDGKYLTQQYGIQAGVKLPGKLNLHFRSSLDAMFDNETRRLIFSQSGGLRVLNNVWAEGNVTFGNLNNYMDNGGLYVYNSKDPTVFKTGATLFWQLLNNVTVYGNYTFESKQMTEIIQTNKTITNYNQHSLSGGIIWKL
jgi:tetratricopeptide (TPR) repeat protein